MARKSPLKATLLSTASLLILGNSAVHAQQPAQIEEIVVTDRPPLSGPG
jgi:hypothetical protein